MPEETIEIRANQFGVYPVAKWQVGNSPQIAFPVKHLSESGGNRLVPRLRPYRDGAKVDDTGGQERKWSFTVEFESSISEPGLTEINGDAPLYPDILNRLIESFNNHVTGDLVVPTIGTVRARADTYTRDEDSDIRNYAIYKMNFIEDNEDSVRAISFNIPTANSTSKKLGQKTTDDAQSNDMWSDSLSTLEDGSASLEDSSNEFSNTSDDIENNSYGVVSSSRRTNQSFSKPWKEGRNQLNDPEASSVQRDLNSHEDIAARARNDARKGKPQIVAVVASEDQTLMSIATFFSLDFDDLLAINPKLPDPTFIPKSTVVYIYYD